MLNKQNNPCRCDMDSLKTDTIVQSEAAFPVCAWVVSYFLLPPLHSLLPSSVWQSALLCCLCGVVLRAEQIRSRSQA